MIVHTGTDSFPGNSYTGKPQVESSYSFKSMGLSSHNFPLYRICFNSFLRILCS